MASHYSPRGRTDLGLTYHILSVVNRFLFELDPDRMKELFLAIVEEALTVKGFKFKLWNFCIMSNHFHFLITPAEGQSLSEILKWIKMVFAIRWNKMNHKTGHFWGDRFYSRVITDEQDFWNVYNYIDQNPVKAGLVKEPREWKYSGAHHREHGITRIISFVDDTILKSELKVLQ
ncbi:MAG: transposase [Spirochaetaceae bacterium]|nr:transposase [Spirochaetaceae bacterium]